MSARRTLGALALACLLAAPSARADDPKEIGHVDTALTNLGLTRSHRVVIERFDDPKVDGVSCWMSHAQTGGLTGSLGLAEDPSRFALTCAMTGPIAFRSPPSTRATGEEVFERNTSIWFKETRVTRFLDRDRRTLVYVAWSTRLVDGSPYNALGVVPIPADAKLPD